MCELDNGLAPLSWEERARLDSGKPLAPAYDENGNGCWNVWVDDAVFPETFHDSGEARTYAERKDSEGHKVFTDFD